MFQEMKAGTDRLFRGGWGFGRCRHRDRVPRPFPGPSARSQGEGRGESGIFASGALGAVVLAGGLALAAALFLAPGAARAVNDCGALNSGNSFTENCPDAAYTGIVYWDQANAVTLTVPGTATTATITAGANNGLHNGITIRTNDDTTSPRTSAVRNIALTVGGSGTFVAIAQSGTRASSWYNNRGILVRQRDGDGATTTLDVKSGVTIGTATNKMENGGIEVVVDQSDAGAVTVTSGAAIYSEADGDRPGGIHIGNAGSGAVTLTNSGAIVSDARGINVQDTGSAGAVTLTNSGAITSAATTGLEGIRAVSTGKDADGDDAGVSVTHSAGAIAVAMGGVGIRAHVGTSRSEGDTGGGTYITPENEGLAKVAVTGGSVTSKGIAVEAVNYEAGSVVVEVSDGATLTSTEGFGIDAVLTDVGNTAGTVSVTSGGAVTADVLSGIRARNSAGNAGAVTVAVTGGSVTTKGTRTHAVEALQEGTGDAIVDVSDGAAITSRQNAGILARLRLAGNDEGQVKVTQGGTIAGRTGVHAYVSRDSVVTIAAGTTTTETREEAAGPVIDITWTGSFSHGTTATVAQDDSDRWAASDATFALTHHRTVEAGKYDRGDNAGKGTRYGTPAGIEAQVMSWNDVAARVAEADDPGMIMDNTEQMNLLSTSHADSRRTAILAAFKAALGNGDIDVADGVFDAVKTGETSLDDVTDAEIVTYLSTDDADTRTLLRNVLKYSLSEAEMAVLRAAVTDTGLDAALDDEDAGFSDTYKMEVKAFLNDFNVGDIRIAVGNTSVAGSIASRGDGIRAYYATPNDKNGAIDVTIAAGTTVTGGMAGIYVANAGAMGTGAERILKQTVTVNGMVTGGMDAAVHLSGGGKLTVGEMGKVYAGSSGRAILVNDPGRSIIEIHGEVRGGSGSGADAVAAVDTTGGGRITLGRTGRVMLADGATDAIRADRVTGSDATTEIILVVDGMVVHQGNAKTAVDRLGGAVVGDAVPVDDDDMKVVNFAATNADGTTGVATPAPLTEGVPDISGLRPAPREEEEEEEPPSETPRPPQPQQPQPQPAPTKMICDLAMDKRCSLYEALPSVLLAMNDLPTYAERMSAARDGRGGWVQVETAGGKWKADRSTEQDVAYDHRRHGVRAGMDFAVGEGGRAGVSVHGLRGSAEMTKNGGEVELSGGGLGVNATAMVAGDVHVDAQAAVTWYDVDVESALRRSLKKDARGRGYVLGVEVGRRMSVMDGVSVTPRGGLRWSKVDMDDFTDLMDTRVSVEDADSLVGRVGLMVDRAVGSEEAPGRVFGSVDVEHEFKDETSVDVLGTTLKTTARSSGVRLGLGGEFTMREGVVLRARVNYTRSGGDTNEYGGGVELNLRF